MKPERPVRTLMRDDSGEAVTNPFMVTGAFTISVNFKSRRRHRPGSFGAAESRLLTNCAVQHK